MKMTFALALVALTSCVFAQDKPKADKFCDSPLNQKSAAALLAAMDHDLDQIEQGGNPCGSFTDYFAINAADAITAGASRKEVDRRVARLIALAEKKIYLSGYETELAENGGTAEVKKYMDDILRDAKVNTSKTTDSHAVSIPNWVQIQLARMKSGKSVECHSTFGHGAGFYHLTEGHDIPFYWYSYSNSDGWEQIALTTRVFGFDRRSIRALRDQLGRLGVYDSWASKDITWIGMSNDLWCRDDLQHKYMHVAKWTNMPGGGKVGEYEFHRAELTHDYLDRITTATGGHLRFTIVE